MSKQTKEKELLLSIAYNEIDRSLDLLRKDWGLLLKPMPGQDPPLVACVSRGRVEMLEAWRTLLPHQLLCLVMHSAHPHNNWTFYDLAVEGGSDMVAWLIYDLKLPIPPTHMEEDVTKMIADVTAEEAQRALWKTPFKCSNQDRVNGYALFNGDEKNMSFSSGMSFLTIWNDTKENERLADDEVMRELLDDLLCSDWSKMDRNGNPFGGFYDFAKGTEERENAYYLTGQDNIDALLALPYPRAFIVETTKIGCASRQESVRHSNFLCHYMSLKIKYGVK